MLNAIVEADKESLSKLGHGNALAQPYAHIIMPLSKYKYRKVAIDWGLKYFERFFEREPEGFWLPEAAVDSTTLEILAQAGIKFVLLGPHQIKSVARKDGTKEAVGPDGADFRRTYKAVLPSGNTIGVIVYDRWLSGLVAFGDLLKSGELLARRALERFDNRAGAQIVTLAVDGETFGHHKRGGEVELAKALDYVERNGVRLTNLAHFYSISPPQDEVEIAENTSWSCPHGVERWRSNCGCGSEIRPGWTQEWRAPLRQAVDYLADNALKVFESLAPTLLNNPDAALDDYFTVMLDREPGVVEKYLDTYAIGSEEAKSKALELLELFRHSLLAQSSDAWFFEDIFRPEPIQAMKHMARALELLKGLTGYNIENHLLEILRKARSNVPDVGNGEDIYIRYALSSAVSPAKAASMLAMRLLFEASPSQEFDYYSYHAILEGLAPLRLGRARGLTGIATLISRVTWQHYRLMFASLYYGWYDVYAGAKPLANTDEYERLERVFSEYFSKGMLRDLVSYISKELSEGFIDVLGALPDERNIIIGYVTESAVVDLSRQFDQLYDLYAPLMEYLKQTGTEYPAVFKRLMEHYVDKIMEQTLIAEPINVELIKALASIITKTGLRLSDFVGRIIARKVADLVDLLVKDPTSKDTLQKLIALIDVYRMLEFAEAGLSEARRKLLMAMPTLLTYADQIKQLGLVTDYNNLARLLRVKNLSA